MRAWWFVGLLWACGGDKGEETGQTAPTGTETTTSTSTSTSSTPTSTSTSTSSTTPTPVGAPTYYGDALHVFQERCVSCHQYGGIGTFAIDDYETAKAYAPLIRTQVENRSMPPWLVTGDGSCQTFEHSAWLEDDELATILDWVDAGAHEGDVADGPSDEVEIPGIERVDWQVQTPTFLPEIQGGPLAAFDEYRCFLVENPYEETVYLTDFEVQPGTPEIIHHVIAYQVDLGADIWGAARTNGEEIELLNGADGREGWSCFGTAGGSIDDSGTPVSWAPGMGPVHYPEGVGIPFTPNEVLVVQVHYNMVDPGSVGLTDSTTLNMMGEPSVERVAKYALMDPFIESLFAVIPEIIPAGESDYSYTWNLSGYDVLRTAGFDGFAEDVRIEAVLPHMHEYGTEHNASLTTDGDTQCLSEVKDWDFNWQLAYFYEDPLPITSADELEVTCHWDTSFAVLPLIPGWGTGNEMCLMGMLLSAPAGD